jgi:signal transduction histidine kinase
VPESQQPRRLECVMRRSNGTSFDADAMLSPVQNAASLGIVRERELGELKSRFVSMASHEFRAPLSTILASSEFLRHYSARMSEDRRQWAISSRAFNTWPD